MCTNCYPHGIGGNSQLAQSLGMYKPHSLYAKYYVIRALNKKYGYYDQVEDGTFDEMLSDANSKYIICHIAGGKKVKLRPLSFFTDEDPNYQVEIFHVKPEEPGKQTVAGSAPR